MYPLKFKKNVIEKIWGGTNFKKVLNFSLPEDVLYGESWEVSSRNENLSYIENGKFKERSLIDLIENYKEKLVGQKVFQEFQNKFPLLIKYLDINDRLSIQVHPNDNYALEVENDFGKSESWYIMEASEDATLILGLDNNITKDIFKEKIKNHDFSNLFNTVKVKKGDFINITPGTVHATLKGSILICEIQQNSDTTYRIYDFDRKVNGKLRELHLSKALDVINFNQKVDISTNETRKKIYLVNAQKEELIRGQYFNIDKYLINGEFQDEINENFKIYSILNGNGFIICNNIKYPVKKGDTYFIPACLNTKLEGKIEILKSFI